MTKLKASEATGPPTPLASEAHTAYWYQVEPHAAFPPLPDVEARQHSSAWVNPMQWLVVGILALTLVAVLAYAWAAAGQHGAAADLALSRFAQSGPGS